MINTHINKFTKKALQQNNNSQKIIQKPHFKTLYITQVKENADNIKKIGQELEKEWTLHTIHDHIEMTLYQV